MSPKEIIAEAWHMTIRHKRILLPWGALEAFIVMIAAMLFVIYQGFVLTVFIQTGDSPTWESIMGTIMPIIGRFPGLTVTLLVLSCIYGVLWIVVPRVVTGALIGLAAKIHCGDEPKGGFVIGVFSFLPLLELAAAFVIIDGKTLFSAWSVLVRYMGAADVMLGTSIFLILIWCIAFVFHFLFMFAEEAIVIRKFGVFRSIGHSFKLVISYLGRVVLIAVLLLVIILRIILNAIVIFVIPAIIFGLGFLLTRFLPEIVSFGISGLIGITIALIASYFLGYVTVFKNAVWTITYLELSKEKELDVIEPEEVAEVTETPEESAETPKT